MPCLLNNLLRKNVVKTMKMARKKSYNDLILKNIIKRKRSKFYFNCNETFLNEKDQTKVYSVYKVLIHLKSRF